MSTSPGTAIAAKERLLVTRIGALGLTRVFERSIKLSYGTLSPNRFIYFMDRQCLRDVGFERVLRTCRELAMPSPLCELLKRIRERVSSLYFGFEASNDSCLYKVYAEFDDPLRQAAAGKPQILGALGLKWDAFEPAHQFVTQYTWIPDLTEDDMRRRIAGILTPHHNPKLLDFVGEVLSQTKNRIETREVIYLEVTEPSTQRKAFDLNLYDAQLRFIDVYAAIARLCAHYAIPLNALNASHPDFWRGALGHLNGGIGRNGRDSVSLYGRFGETGGTP